MSQTVVEASPFAPAGVEFMPISPLLAKARILIELAIVVPMLVVAATLGVLVSPWFYLAVGVLVAYLIWVTWLIPRQVRAWGYAETPDDLVFRHGIFFRKMTAVPYGRMQFVDVKQGPVDRYFRIASVHLFTASTATLAHISGLGLAEATRLRQTLMERGEASRAGL